MDAYTLAHLSDAALLADLSTLVATDRRTTAALLAHLAEVEARELYLPEACSSLFAYCTRVLRISDDAALKRIRAARTARRFPQIFAMLADGRLHLSGVVVLGPHLTAESVDGLLAAAAHRSKADIEVLVARHAPQPDLPTAITPLEPSAAPAGAVEVAPGPPPAPEGPRPRVKPLSPERYGLQVTISQATRDKLDRAQALLRHRNPSGDVAEVLDRALDALLANLEKEKFAATSRPRAAKARAAGANPRYTANHVKREVHARDGEQCSFVSAAGVRCTERGFLELDHRKPVALGGQPTVDGMRYLCHAHNQYEAQRLLGADFMRARRQAAAAQRAATPTRSAAPFDADVSLALSTMGFKSPEVTRAMAASAQQPATTFEERIRAALAELRSRPSRCSDAPFHLEGDVDPRRLASGHYRPEAEYAYQAGPPLSHVVPTYGSTR